MTSDADFDVYLFTDGACSGNPGPGGWAYILRHSETGVEHVESGGETETTNNRMEMLAAIRGLEKLTRRCKVQLLTDSSYVANGLSQWLAGWKKNGWQRREGRSLKPVKNEDLWRQLDALAQEHDIVPKRVKGHSGHPENERCDELAVEACQKMK